MPSQLIISELEEYKRHFQALESRMLWVQGNHDPSYSTFEAPIYYAQNLTDDQLYEYMFRYQTLYPNRVMSPVGSYYYAEDAVIHMMTECLPLMIRFASR